MKFEAPRSDIRETYSWYVEWIHDDGNDEVRQTGEFMSAI